MKRASYRQAIQWIANNDSEGEADALNPEVVAYYVTSLLVADIFGVDEVRVGEDVVRARKQAKKWKCEVQP